MEKLIIVDKDIKRCNKVLNENNLLELAIVIEEIIDKNKDDISSLEKLKKDNVWFYNKKDLKILIDKLEEQKENLINKYSNIITNEKSINKEPTFTSLIEAVNNDKNLDEIKRKEILDMINKIKLIDSEDISKEEKWNKVKLFMDYLSISNYGDGRYIIKCINLII